MNEYEIAVQIIKRAFHEQLRFHIEELDNYTIKGFDEDRTILVTTASRCFEISYDDFTELRRVQRFLKEIEEFDGYSLNIL